MTPVYLTNNLDDLDGEGKKDKPLFLFIPLYYSGEEGDFVWIFHSFFLSKTIIRKEVSKLIRTEY